MLYPQHFIDDLKIRADIVRIVEGYVPLKKKGANWMACCPFHQEKTPSFGVNPGKGMFKCFGCGKGGNVFTFVMEMEGVSFPEAIRIVADRAGMMLPEPVDDKNYQKTKEKREADKKLADEIIALNTLALEFWEAELAGKTKDAKAARKYLEDRGISDDIQKTFRIGYAPDSWDSTLNLLKKSGATEKLIEQSGLVSVNEEKKRTYDRFRGRIIFPVLDVEGRPVAFGGRIIDKGEPKYLNSPETAAYIKGNNLYGLFQNKEAIRKKKFAILVEGYLDLIALCQAGITNCVATLGTACTEAQAKLLGRFARKVVVNYDGDEAGVKAARRAIETLLAEDFETKVLVLPLGADPDDFIRTQGVESYNQLRGKATPFLEFTLDNSIRDRNLAVPRQKAEAIEDVLPVIAAIRNKIQRRESFDQAMDFLRVEDAALKTDLWRTVETGAHHGAGIRQSVARSAKTNITVAERRLLELLISDLELRKAILPQLEETDFDDLVTASIYRALLALHEEATSPSVEKLAEIVADDPLAMELLPELFAAEDVARVESDAGDNAQEEAERCWIALRTMAISNRIQGIMREMMLADQHGDMALRDQLATEQIKLERLKLEFERATTSEKY